MCIASVTLECDRRWTVYEFALKRRACIADASLQFTPRRRTLSAPSPAARQYDAHFGSARLADPDLTVRMAQRER